MLRKPVSNRLALGTLLFVLLTIPGIASSYHGGIGGEQVNAGETIDDVAKEGCLCHNGAADNSVQIILDDVPYAWEAGQVYEMKLQIIGGPAAASPWTAGFSMRVSDGVLSGENLQNWEEDPTTLTQTEAAAGVDDRMWIISWQAPAADAGVVDFWIAGNSVNGDQVQGQKISGINSFLLYKKETKRPLPWGPELCLPGTAMLAHQNQRKPV